MPLTAPVASAAATMRLDVIDEQALGGAPDVGAELGARGGGGATTTAAAVAAAAVPANKTITRATGATLSATLANSKPAHSYGSNSFAAPPTRRLNSNSFQQPSTRPLHHSHYATINRLNEYLISRQAAGDCATGGMVEFQCLDCDQFIVTERASVLHRANELRLMRESELNSLEAAARQWRWPTPANVAANVGLDSCQWPAAQQPALGSQREVAGEQQQMALAAASKRQMEQIERAYVAALNGLPLCPGCEKKRAERREIISEFVETERKYGRDLRIIHDEFYRPMQVAGLLNRDQISAIFLNLDELIAAQRRFLESLELALQEARSMGDAELNSVNIGRLFMESADMLHTFESYCVRQGSAACQLARLAKERELLRIFLRVSQMENTLLRRMNLAAFLMVPVQRVTKYPLLLNRLYKVTAYHHKDREALRDAQLKVELHLEHINQQTKGVSATNKIWRRLSSLSAPSMGGGGGGGGSLASSLASSNSSSCTSSASSASSAASSTNGSHPAAAAAAAAVAAAAAAANRRALMSAEDIGYIKLRKSALELLKWDRDETQFVHSGRINFAPLNEFLVRQKSKSIRYMGAQALLVALGKPNWRYRPDLVKSSADYKLLVPAPGGCGLKEAALLLFREKNGRFVACHEPIFLSNCVLSNDCSLFNSELPHCHPSALAPPAAQSQQQSAQAQQQQQQLVGVGAAKPGGATGTLPTPTTPAQQQAAPKSLSEFRAASAELPCPAAELAGRQLGPPAAKRFEPAAASQLRPLSAKGAEPTGGGGGGGGEQAGSMSSLKSLPDEGRRLLSLAPIQTSRSYSLASALPRAPISATSPSGWSSGSGGEPASQPSQSQQAAQPAGQSACAWPAQAEGQLSQAYYHHHFFHNHHAQPYGGHEESFELHERLSKESLLLRADTPLKTRYWLQMLRYHAKDLGHWRQRRQGLANIMMVRQE